MAINTTLLRTLLNNKISQDPQILTELNLGKSAELINLSDQQLEILLTPKILGILAIKKEDLEL